MPTPDYKVSKLIIPQVGHDYMPDWIDVPFNVTSIVGDTVYGEFYSGHARKFKRHMFIDNFRHYEDCLLCKAEET